MNFPDLNTLNKQIHQEADALLHEQGLHALLMRYGQPHYTGSYALELMTWRDLDIYLESELNSEQFFQLGSELASLLSPLKMSYRNEHLGKTPGLPQGLYWGIYLGNERKGAWKIDIWAMDKKTCSQRMEFCTNLQNQLTTVNRQTILQIKAQCWQDPAYRKTYTSSDIYEAVLYHQVIDLPSFHAYLSRHIHQDQLKS